jgi:superfamily II DNA helicase RecQ
MQLMRHIVFLLGDMTLDLLYQSRIFKKTLPFYSILALTATADKATRKDISQQLNLLNQVFYLLF